MPLRCALFLVHEVEGTIVQAQLPGFYDPCPGESKVLLIQYDYREASHSVVYNDDDGVYLPMSGEFTTLTVLFEKCRNVAAHRVR